METDALNLILLGVGLLFLLVFIIQRNISDYRDYLKSYHAEEDLTQSEHSGRVAEQM
jgi:hypothetical protein